MKKGILWFMFLLLTGWAGLPAAMAEENNLPSLNAGIDQLAFQLTTQVAERYFDAEKRPVVRVAVFDFVDDRGNITTVSHYVSNRIRLAFAKGLQFNLLPVMDFEKRGYVITAEEFEKNKDLRERTLDQLKADIYIFGTFVMDENATGFCRMALWGVAPPFEHWYKIESVKPPQPLPWKLGLSPSGEAFFSHVLLEGSKKMAADQKRENLGKVIFLTQPICDDLNLSWQVRSDGMVYDIRKESGEGSLRNRTGQVLQSRVKSRDTLKELSYIIKDITFVLKEPGGEAHIMEPYVLPERSDYYFLPFSDEDTGLRFQFLWGKRGESKKPSSIETGKGWKLHEATMDYENILPVGTHIATTTLSPVAESQYGSKRPRSHYVTRFKVSVRPGLNIYVINYVYRRDRPEIFVRRLEIDATQDMPIRSIKKITEVFRVYGSD